VAELIQHLILDQNQLKDEKAIKIMTEIKIAKFKTTEIK
jgi:hypothetical protein